MPVHEGFWGGPRAAPSPRARESTGRPRKCAFRPGCPRSALCSFLHFQSDPRCRGELARSGAQAGQEAAACDGVGHGRYEQKHHLSRVQIFSGVA